MFRKRLVLVVGCLVLAVCSYVLSRNAPPTVTTGEAPSAGTELPPSPAARIETRGTATREAPSGGTSPAPTVNRIELTRPAQPGSKPVQQPPSVDGPAPPVDRRTGVHPNASRQLEIIGYAFDTLHDDIQNCLDQWEAIDPAQVPEVMIGFELDATGLTRSYVEHADDVPLGPRTCFANAVYGLDWAHIVDAPALVTHRFTIEARDAGR